MLHGFAVLSGLSANLTLGFFQGSPFLSRKVPCLRPWFAAGASLT